MAWIFRSVQFVAISETASSCDSNGCRAVGGCIILHKFCYKVWIKKWQLYKTGHTEEHKLLCFVLTLVHDCTLQHTRACTFSMYALAYKHILTPQQKHVKSKGDALMGEGGEQCCVSLWARSTTCRKLAATSSKVFFLMLFILWVGPVAQSVQRLSTGWTVRDRIPVGTRFSARPDLPWGPPRLLHNGYRVFPGVKCGRGVMLTTQTF